MLIQSSASTSVEAAMSFANHREQDLLCQWVPSKTWQSCSERGKLSKDGSELLIASNICANSRVNLPKRRKLQKSSVMVFPVGTQKDEVSRYVVKGSSKTRIEYDNSVVVALPAPSCLRDFGRSNAFVHSQRPYANPHLEAKRSNNSDVESKSRIRRNKEIRSDKFRSSASDMGVGCCHTKTEDRKASQENPFLKSPSSSWSHGISRFEMGPIALMLKYPEPYKSRVRIGESFQAEVPDWSDQISNDLDSTGEPLEMDPTETVGLHVHFSDQFSKHNSISNWLQCQEVLNNDTKGCVEGTICGKWRRAPFSEVQTDNWDCSCSIRWDPLHSDCAVPQELETDEVLRHLKYLEQLRSRLDVKKRKLDSHS